MYTPRRLISSFEKFPGTPVGCMISQCKIEGTMEAVARVPAVVMILLAVMFLDATVWAQASGLEPRRRSVINVENYESGSGGSFSLSMLHRDHLQSPLRNPHANNWTLAQRLKEATRRSSEHTKWIQNKIRVGGNNSEAVNSSSSHSREAQLPGVNSSVFSQQGEYIAYLNLGTPPQQFVAILDSGSDLAWVECEPCNTCVSLPGPAFDPAKSASYKTLPCASNSCDLLALPSPSPACRGRTVCPYKYQYGDGTSSSGDFATDTITLSSTSGGRKAIPKFAFGCGTQNSGDLAGSDGVVGIGRGPFSLPSQLGSVVGNQFSICLVSMQESTRETSPLVLGNESFASAGASRWTPIQTNNHNPAFYYVRIDSIKVDGHALLGIPASTFAIDSSGGGGTIIDTGTTVTELLPNAYEALVANLSAAVEYVAVDGTDYGFDLCWNTGNAPASGPGLPSITFGFRWSDFTLPAESAYVEADVDVRCLSFSSGDGVNIIGNLHLQNMRMFFNNDFQVIGWKPAQCDQIQ